MEEGAPAPEAGMVRQGSSWKLRAEGLRGSLVLFQGKLKTYGGALRGTWHEEEHHLLPSPIKASPATTEGLPPASSGASLPHVCTRDSFPYRCHPFLSRLPGADCHSTHDICFSCFPPVQSSVYTSGACSSLTFPVLPSHAAFTHPARKVHKAHSWFSLRSTQCLRVFPHLLFARCLPTSSPRGRSFPTFHLQTPTEVLLKKNLASESDRFLAASKNGKEGKSKSPQRRNHTAAIQMSFGGTSTPPALESPFSTLYGWTRHP